MTSGLLEYEHRLWSGGLTSVAGIDEAGRGPLAGPVVAAAVILDPEDSGYPGELDGLTDSKQLTPAKREFFFEIISGNPRIAHGIGVAAPAEIDEINILQATYQAMRRAIADLPGEPEHALVDGLPVPGLPCDSTSIVKGDSLSLSIAAASVVAKVTRDRMMLELHKQYPRYGFDSHKGYGSKRHMQALLECGPCTEHRRSFRPVRESLDIIRRRKEEPGGPEQLEMQV